VKRVKSRVNALVFCTNFLQMRFLVGIATK
jgi:hypothetical protein